MITETQLDIITAEVKAKAREMDGYLALLVDKHVQEVALSILSSLVVDLTAKGIISILIQGNNVREYAATMSQAVERKVQHDLVEIREIEQAHTTH